MNCKNESESEQVPNVGHQKGLRHDRQNRVPPWKGRAVGRGISVNPGASPRGQV